MQTDHMDIDIDDDVAHRREAVRARLVEQIAARLPEQGDHATEVPGLSLHRRDEYCEPICLISEPSLSLVVQGTKRATLGNTAVEYGYGRVMLTSIDLPMISQVFCAPGDEPFLGIMLKLDLAVVRHVVAQMQMRRLRTPPASGAFRFDETAPPDVLEAVLRLCRLANDPSDIAMLADAVIHEIVYRLLKEPFGRQLRDVATLGTAHGRMAGVIDWMKQNFSEPVRVERLADMAAMGVATFHHHFSALTGRGPLQYQKQLRLHHARRILLTEALDSSTVAFRVGYESVSQFNREYRRAFGEPPMRDIARLRSNGTGVFSVFALD